MFEYLLLTQCYETLHDQRFLHSIIKRFFVFLPMSVLVYIRKRAMNRVYCKFVGDGEICMLTTRTEININYYKLDNIKCCLNVKQSTIKYFAVYLQHYIICWMKTVYCTRVHSKLETASSTCDRISWLLTIRLFMLHRRYITETRKVRYTIWRFQN